MHDFLSHLYPSMNTTAGIFSLDKRTETLTLTVGLFIYNQADKQIVFSDVYELTVDAHELDERNAFPQDIIGFDYWEKSGILPIGAHKQLYWEINTDYGTYNFQAPFPTICDITRC